MKAEDPIKVLHEKFSVRISNPKLLIMPSFNEILGGLPVNIERPENLLGPLLQANATNIDNAEAYLLDGTLLGSVKQLRHYGKRTYLSK